MTRASAPWWATAAILILCTLTLWAMGRVPICECGYIKLWHGEPWSGENSQHLSDWYSFGHVIHGFLAYGAYWLLRRRVPFGWGLAAGTFTSALWEVVENTDLVIQRFRAVTISLNYYGDSVVNSTADNLAMIAGFLAAARLPWWATLGLALGFEALTTLVMRDSLALGTLMLIWPVEAVKLWQEGGA